LKRTHAPDVDVDEPDREIVFRFEEEALTDGRLAR
jgi:MinD superfamily P-loop ATPase